MLLQIPPEKIKDYWGLVRPMIVQTLPPTLKVQADAMSNILSALMREEAQFWVGYRKEGDGNPIYILVTSVLVDQVAGARYLLIYSMYALTRLNNQDYVQGLDTLKKFAEVQNCREVLAYVENDTFVHRLEQVGGSKVTNLVRL